MWNINKTHKSKKVKLCMMYNIIDYFLTNSCIDEPDK